VRGRDCGPRRARATGAGSWVRGSRTRPTARSCPTRARRIRSSEELPLDHLGPVARPRATEERESASPIDARAHRAVRGASPDPRPELVGQDRGRGELTKLIRAFGNAQDERPVVEAERWRAIPPLDQAAPRT